MNEQSDREALGKTLYDTLAPEYTKEGHSWEDLRSDPMYDETCEAWRNYADAILAAGLTRPRVVETAEELEALPLGAIVRGGDGCAYERFSKNGDPSTWFVAGLSDANRPPLPATVLFT